MNDGPMLEQGLKGMAGRTCTCRNGPLITPIEIAWLGVSTSVGRASELETLQKLSKLQPASTLDPGQIDQRLTSQPSFRDHVDRARGTEFGTAIIPKQHA